MAVIEYPRQSFDKMSRKQAITTCYALEDMRDRAVAEVERLTYDRNHPYGELAIDPRPDPGTEGRGRIFQRMHAGTDTLRAHVQTDCCRECPQWAS